MSQIRGKARNDYHGIIPIRKLFFQCMNCECMPKIMHTRAIASVRNIACE